MRILIEVVCDLATFVHEAIMGKSSTKEVSVTPVPSARVVNHETTAQHPVTFMSQPSANELITGSQAYIVSTTSLYTRPVVAFDSVLTTLKAGTAVIKGATAGEYTHVVTGAFRGWVERAALNDDKSAVWPDFTAGEVYEATHFATRAVRQMIDDSFGASVLFLPLQPQEFVTYRLKEQSRVLPEVLDRPRTVGQWQHIFKGKPGVVIGVEPKTGSIIEGALMTERPYLGIVTEVHVDRSIVIESVGRYFDGVYAKELLSAETWRETSPVFIQV